MRVIAARVALAALLALAASCGKPPTVEQRVIANIREMEAKVEAGQSLAFMQHLDEGFTAQNGSMNRDQVRALLILQLKRYKQLQAQLFPIAVVPVGEDAATATFRALVTGGPNWIPEHGQVYEFRTSWRKVDGDWLLFAADWDPVDLDEVL
jgi:hypothetical protein